MIGPVVVGAPTVVPTLHPPAVDYPLVGAGNEVGVQPQALCRVVRTRPTPRRPCRAQRPQLVEEALVRVMAGDGDGVQLRQLGLGGEDAGVRVRLDPLPRGTPAISKVASLERVERWRPPAARILCCRDSTVCQRRNTLHSPAWAVGNRISTHRLRLGGRGVRHSGRSSSGGG